MSEVYIFAQGNYGAKGQKCLIYQKEKESNLVPTVATASFLRCFCTGTIIELKAIEIVESNMQSVAISSMKTSPRRGQGKLAGVVEAGERTKVHE